MQLKNGRKLFLFRHGLATHSKRGYGKGIVTARILPEAIPAVRRIGRFIKEIPDSVNYSSEFMRCRETAEIVTQESGKQFIFDSRLNEKHKEKISQVRKRVKSFIAFLDSIPNENIVLCTHGVIIAAIKNLLLNGKFVTRNLIDYPQTGQILIVQDNTTKIVDCNK